MQLLGRYRHLGAQAELATIGKAGTGVDLHGRRIHLIDETGRGMNVIAQYPLGVTT